MFQVLLKTTNFVIYKDLEFYLLEPVRAYNLKHKYKNVI